MSSAHATGPTLGSSMAATRVPPESSAPARISTELPRRNTPEDRSPSPSSRHDGEERSTERDGTHIGAARGSRRDEPRDGVPSEEDGDTEEPKMEGKGNVSGLDEFPLISVPLDTWVGRYVRITTPRHNGTTGLVHRTGNGWVNLLTANGEVAKRAYDLVVIPEERANIRRGDAGTDKGDSRGKRHRGTKALQGVGLEPGAEPAQVSMDAVKAWCGIEKDGEVTEALAADAKEAQFKVDSPQRTEWARFEQWKPGSQNLFAALGRFLKQERPSAFQYLRASCGANEADPSSIGSTSGSGDERKAVPRSRSTRTSAVTAPPHSSSDSSGQDDDQDDDGEDDEHENNRSKRPRSRATLDGSDYDDGDDDDDDKDDRYDRYDEDARFRTNARVKLLPLKSSRTMPRAVRERGDKFTGDFPKEPGRSASRISGKYNGRETAHDKCRGRNKSDQEKMKDRERVRGGGDQNRTTAGREREGVKGENFMSFGRGKDKEADVASRTKRKETASSLPSLSEVDEKVVSGGVGRDRDRDRVDRSKDKPAAPTAGKKEEVVKQSWLNQISKGRERPNLVRWREELVAITKDSSEDYEDATLSVELMRMRCDVCYHEKADGDKFCWNDQCWLSPIFVGYFKTGPYESDGSSMGVVENSSTQRVGYVNTFGRETVIDSALTSTLQAPVKWLETRKKLEAHELFSDDPALYRWQCWASTFKDPNSKDPTFVDEKRTTNYSTGTAHRVPGSRLSPERKGADASVYDICRSPRACIEDSDVHDRDLDDSHVIVKPEVGIKRKHSAQDPLRPVTVGLGDMDVAPAPASGFFPPPRADGVLDGPRSQYHGEEVPVSRKNIRGSVEDESHSGVYVNEDKRHANKSNTDMPSDGTGMMDDTSCPRPVVRRGERRWQP